MMDTSSSSSSPLMNSHQAIQAAVLMRNPKSRLRLKSRGAAAGGGSSSSASASNSSLASPSPTTPPTTTMLAATGGSGYFGRAEFGKRRDSLSRAIREAFTLNNIDGGIAGGGGGDASVGGIRGGEAGGGKSDDDRNENGDSHDPVKRVVTRRGNLLVCGSFLRFYFLSPLPDYLFLFMNKEG